MNDPQRPRRRAPRAYRALPLAARLYRPRRLPALKRLPLLRDSAVPLRPGGPRRLADAALLRRLAALLAGDPLLPRDYKHAAPRRGGPRGDAGDPAHRAGLARGDRPGQVPRRPRLLLLP